MKLYSTNAINALGLKGPETFPETIKKFIKQPIEHIQVDNDNIQESQQILYKKSKEIFSAQKQSIIIGGDHSITYPIIKAFKELHKNLFLIVFDAHADCDFPNEEPTHEEWLRKIIEEGFPGEKIILIGLRKMWEVEKEFLEEHKIKIYKEIEDLEKIKNHNLYISIDIDALDPSEAPAVNYPEKNGLTKAEFFDILKKILEINPPLTVDITEAYPEKDKENKTTKLIEEIIEKLSSKNYRE